MEQLGHPRSPILIGANREPIWPKGLVGSITHTDCFVAAAVAWSAVVRGIGIDAEPDAALPADVVDYVACPAEKAWLRGADPDAVRHPCRLLFCVKEAAYKVWYPLARRWLDFTDVIVEFDVERSTFAVEILIDGPVRRLSGRYVIADGVIVAAIELKAS
jgi:4'-phosphopantetheinyl transferase EntD